nr:hypothetical protein [uncultured Chryseobacterium sp.]
MTKSIEQIEVVYKKNKRFSGALAYVTEAPFTVAILAKVDKENSEHLIDFESAQQMTISFSDGTVKTFMDEIV